MFFGIVGGFGNGFGFPCEFDTDFLCLAAPPAAI